MTERLYKTLEKAVKDGVLFDWLYSHQEELSKDEIAHIARELSYAIDNTSGCEANSKYAVRETFQIGRAHV